MKATPHKTRLACVSVDLDSLHHYCRIHGLPESVLGEEARALVYSRAMPRFLELFARARVPATLFVIGEDALAPFSQAPLKDAHARGLELASHSHSHPYDLSRLEEAEIGRELEQAAAAIERLSGRRPVGFRAPGYTLSARLYRALEARGYAYDSSAYPAAPYYLAKGAVMGALRLLGRPSRAVLDRPRVLGAPRSPYRPDPAEPYRRGPGRTLELPIAVTPVSRMPFIGTFALTLPRGLVRLLYAELRGTPLLNFELHGIDLLEEADGAPARLAGQQRDLKVPWEKKARRLEELLAWLARDFDLVTLERAAGHFGEG